MTNAILQELKAIVGEDHVDIHPAVKSIYSKDQSPLSAVPFDALIKPASAHEIAAILQLAARCKIAVTARGGGHGRNGRCAAAAGRYYTFARTIEPHYIH